MSVVACPTPDELERFAFAGITTDPLAVHVASCGHCRKRVERLRADHELIAELKAASGAAVTDRTRRRLLAICRKAAFDAAGSARSGS